MTVVARCKYATEQLNIMYPPSSLPVEACEQSGTSQMARQMASFNQLLDSAKLMQVLVIADRKLAPYLSMPKIG